jgi:hypothetical protein
MGLEIAVAPDMQNICDGPLGGGCDLRRIRMR